MRNGETFFKGVRTFYIPLHTHPLEYMHQTHATFAYSRFVVVLHQIYIYINILSSFCLQSLVDEFCTYVRNNDDDDDDGYFLFVCVFCGF